MCSGDLKQYEKDTVRGRAGVDYRLCLFVFHTLM